MIELWRILVENGSTVIVIFTGVLVIVTTVYTVGTLLMLRQSKNAFLADLFCKMIEGHINHVKDAEEKGELKDWASPEGRAFVWTMGMAWFEGFRGGFAKIDKRLAKRLEETFREGMERIKEQYEKDLETAVARKRQAEVKVQELQKKLQEQKNRDEKCEEGQ